MSDQLRADIADAIYSVLGEHPLFEGVTYHGAAQRVIDQVLYRDELSGDGYRYVTRYYDSEHVF